MKVTRRNETKVAGPRVIELSDNEMKNAMGGCCDEGEGEQLGAACCCCCCGTVVNATFGDGHREF